MRRDDLADLAAFAVVAEERNFTRAARRLGLSQSALSQIVKRLEERLGVALIARTTRSVAPTRAGEALLGRLTPALNDLDAGIAELMEMREAPAGLVRITSPEHAANTILLPAVAGLLGDHPGITVEIDASYRLVDIVAEGFDGGVRLGEQVDRDMVAVRIGPEIPMAVVGAPAYFDARPAPQTPQDLLNHHCIHLRLPTPGATFGWRLSRDGREIATRLGGRLVVNSIALMRGAALAGLGLAYLPLDQVEQDVREGRLQRALADWTTPLPGYHLYYPSRRQVTPAFRLLIERLRTRA